MVGTKKQKKPVDVRSLQDVEEFENMLSVGPITVVLVYADWCGHCQTFKKNVWSNLTALPNRKVNLASVHYDQLENTSQKDAKIEGYPSVLIVGNDKKAADFKNENGERTNAMPNANSLEAMKTLVEADATAILQNKNGLTAPEVKEDVLVKRQEGGGTRRRRGQTKKQRGGSLLQSLISVAKDIGHVALLTGVAASVSKKKKIKKTRKGRRSN